MNKENGRIVVMSEKEISHVNGGSWWWLCAGGVALPLVVAAVIDEVDYQQGRTTVRTFQRLHTVLNVYREVVGFISIVNDINNSLERWSGGESGYFPPPPPPPDTGMGDCFGA